MCDLLNTKETELLRALNGSLMANARDDFVDILRDNVGFFATSDVDCDYAGTLYFVEFKLILEEKQAPLDMDDFSHGLKVLNTIVDINTNIDCYICLRKCNSRMDCSDELYDKLCEASAHIKELGVASMKQRYLRAVVERKQLKMSISNTNTHISASSSSSSSSSSSGHGTSVHDSNTSPDTSLSDSGLVDASAATANLTTTTTTHTPNTTTNTTMMVTTTVEFSAYPCSLLTHGEIQECVSQANKIYEQECLGEC